MKKFLACFAATLLLRGVMTAFAQPQTKPLPDSKSVVIGDTRVTIFQVGVVAGNMKTGKVIWRNGFAADAVRNDYIVDSLIAIKNYVFFRKTCNGALCSDYGTLIEANSGKRLKTDSILQYFLFNEENYLYFENPDSLQLFYDPEALFEIIRITKFHAVSKQVRNIFFNPNIYIRDTELSITSKDKKCIPIKETGSVQTFKFIQKIESTWNFVFKNARCQINLSFDEYDLEKYTINITRL